MPTLRKSQTLPTTAFPLTSTHHLPNQTTISNPWTLPNNDPAKTPTQRFFEAYAHAVNTRTFTNHPMTKWYAPSIVTRSETLKEFHGPQAMADWMRELFLPFERINHVAESYLEYTNLDGTVSVHATFLRQFWLVGNTSDVPDSSTPLAWIARVGPAETEDGYMGLQWKELRLFWDKTRLVSLVGMLPSDQ